MSKKLVGVFSLMLALVFSASLGFADVSVDIKNDNSLTATGGNATQSQSENQQQKQTTVNNNIIRQLPTVGFAGFLNSGIPILGEGWEVYCPPIYRDKSIERFQSMQTGFKFSSVLPWNWGWKIEAKYWGRVSSKNNVLSCVCYWPKDPKGIIVNGDDVLGAGFHKGEVEQTEESFFADVAVACNEKTGSSRFAVIKKDTFEGVTTGKSIGGSALGTGINDAGTSGAAFVGGGMLGKNRTSVEERSKMKFLCLNDGPTMCGAAAKVEVKISTPPPAPSKVELKAACNPSNIIAWIEYYARKIADCLWPCLNNEYLRFMKGNAFMDWYYCEGKQNKQLLLQAIAEYNVGERDFSNGHELAPGQVFGQKPRGVKTASVPVAIELVQKVRFNRALAEKELNGLPANQADMKR